MSTDLYTSRIAPGTIENPVETDQTVTQLDKLPREAGWALITAGVIGLAVPGVVGTPFLIAGVMVLTPGGSNLLSRWGGGSVMRQINRFLEDLERRYPRS